MDLATVIGLVVTIALMGFAILSGEGAALFFNVPSMTIVFGGTVGVVMVCFPMDVLKRIGKVMGKAFFADPVVPGEQITLLEELSKRARKEGLLALEGSLSTIEDPFMRLGLRLVVDGQEADTVETILRREIESTEDRHATGASLMECAGTYAPAFGMIGTVIGLIQMLQTMDDPASIGPAMAVALITTLYGAMLANVFFLPLKQKLENRSSEEVEAMTMVLEGLLSIHAGDNPRILVQKLTAFMPPADRVGEAA